MPSCGLIKFLAGLGGTPSNKNKVLRFLRFLRLRLGFFFLRFLRLCLGFFGFAGSGLGEGGQAKSEPTNYFGNYVCTAITLALQCFLHCNSFCTAIIFALQLFLHANIIGWSPPFSHLAQYTSPQTIPIRLPRS